MRPRSLKALVLGPVVFAATTSVAFAAAPVSAVPSPAKPNAPWGDITSVVAGPGLTGGAAEGDATLAVAFGGNGTTNTAARSDHNHDDRYSRLGHNHDDRYLQLTGGTLSGNLSAQHFISMAEDGTAPFQVGSDTLVNNLNADRLDGHDASDFAPATINFDDRYAPIGQSFDDRYAPIGINFDDRYALLGHNHDDRYLQLVGGMLTGSLTAPMFQSDAPQGTAPLQVGSDTLVANLNADKLDGHEASDFALASQNTSNYALLSADNTFAGSNTFNAATTFAGSIGLTTGGAAFLWQPFYSGPTAYSLRLMDSRAGATRLVLDQNGRIGIGTTSPAFPLHVVGDIRATNLNLGTALLGPTLFDMSSASDRTFQVTNSGAGVGNLSVEGSVTAGGLSLPTGNGSARSGNDAIAAGGTSRTVSTSAVGSSTLIFITQDASRAGCVAAPADLYVSARAAGSSFTVATGGAAPGAGQSYCFNWFLMN